MSIPKFEEETELLNLYKKIVQRYIETNLTLNKLFVTNISIYKEKNFSKNKKRRFLSTLSKYFIKDDPRYLRLQTYLKTLRK